MNKTCVFCGSRVNSNEDVWPKWLLKLLRTSANEKVPIKTRWFQQPPKEWLTADSALKVKNVCSECNNGWMSQLESEAKPVLSPMILGGAVTLTATQQQKIAAWFTKCAMVFDSMGKGEIFYDALDRHHLRNTSDPVLDSTRIWLGMYSEPNGIRASENHRTLMKTNLSRRPIKIHVFTMSIGHLVLQLTSLKMVHIEDLPESTLSTKGPPMIEALVLIWPANLQGVQWPPSISFNDTDRRLTILAYRFG